MSVDAAADALLIEARATAERILADAQAYAAEHVEAAREAAEGVVARARAQGEQEGALVARRETARRRAKARTVVLAARSALYDEFRRRSRSAVLALRDEPEYRELLGRLAAVARRELGDDAELEIDPADGGGVRGRRGTRIIDLTLPALADRCVDELGPRVARLWA